MTAEQTEIMAAPPMAKWSPRNQGIVIASGSKDARGFRQWKAAGRKVRKGVKAIYIWLPCGGGEDEKTTYFRAIPVFRLEDTEAA